MKKFATYVENIAEAGAACLVTMVQGNILLLAVTHWVAAAQTGLLAGTVAATAITLAKTENRLILAGILGTATAIVDYFVHPGLIGESHITEAIVTGIGAAILSYTISTVVAVIRERLAPRRSDILAAAPGDASDPHSRHIARAGGPILPRPSQLSKE